MILDPYLVKATSEVTSNQLFDAFAKLYPDWSPFEGDDLEMIEAWLQKLRQKPGLALSTGRRNSAHGMLTCSLLEVLGVDTPKAQRSRLVLAWAILDSPVGCKVIGVAPDLDSERAKRRL